MQIFTDHYSSDTNLLQKNMSTRILYRFLALAPPIIMFMTLHVILSMTSYNNL